MTSVEQASIFVTSAISSSHSIKTFPVKWQSIRVKLTELHSRLSIAANGDSGGGGSPLTKLLEEISTTASDIERLAEHCSDDSYKSGKLLMNSNLNVIATKLAIYIKRLNDIYDSEFFMNYQAIVLSKPGVGASRDDMRLYVKELFARMRTGDSEMRLRALVSVNEVLKEDEKYVRIVVDETLDGVSILVKSLEFKDMSVQEEVLQAVFLISGFNSYSGMLVRAGVIPPLIQVLDYGSLLAKERAAITLKELTENCNNSWLVSSQGGVLALLKVCGDEERSSCKLVSIACCVLKNLSGVNEIKRFMLEEGVVSVLLNILRSKDDMAKIQAIEFLYKLVSEDETIKQEVVSEVVVESILTVMNPDKLFSWKARDLTLRAIERFFLSSSAAVHHLLRCGFLHQILFFLRNGSEMDRESALRTVSCFCRVSVEVKKAMGEMGFIAEVMSLLDAKSLGLRETAAETLYSLILVQKIRWKFVEEEENINRVLQLLDPKEGNASTNKVLLSVLEFVTDSSNGRRKIGASVYVKNLEKLAESDMIVAKKIMKKISTNRFRAILNVIWGS